MHSQFYDLCTPEAHRHCRSDSTFSPASAATASPATLATKDGQRDSARGREEEGGGDRGGEVLAEGQVCPRVDYGKYLLNCALKYGGVAVDGEAEKEGGEEEEAEADNEEEGADLEEQVRACLLTDWDLGFSWFHELSL